MRFITSIFMLATAVTGVVSAYFIGHGLVIHETWPYLVAAGLLVTSVVLGFIYMSLSRRDPQPAAHGHGHAHGAHAHTHADGTTHAHPHGPGHHQ